MTPRTTKRAAAAEPAPAAKSAPVRRPRARKAAPAASEPAAAAVDTDSTTDAAPVLTATIAEQVSVVAAHNGAVSSEMIARRAYELFLADGEVHGRDIEHWLIAERELSKSPR